VEEGIRCPDLAGEQVVKWKDLHRPIKLQPLIPPTLPEEHINRVLLEEKKKKKKNESRLSDSPFKTSLHPPSFHISHDVMSSW